MLDYLKEHDIEDEAFAEQVGLETTGRAVRKWKYGETMPRLPTAVRIQEITDGKVTVADLIPAAHPTEKAVA